LLASGGFHQFLSLAAYHCFPHLVQQYACASRDWEKVLFTFWTIVRERAIGTMIESTSNGKLMTLRSAALASPGKAVKDDPIDKSQNNIQTKSQRTAIDKMQAIHPLPGMRVNVPDSSHYRCRHTTNRTAGLSINKHCITSFAHMNTVPFSRALPP
jgi:hypothetical protein